MSDTEFDVVIAAYLIPDLAQDDFDALVKLVADKQLEVEGIALVTVAPTARPSVQETGDHLGRKGMTIGGGVGLVVGLFAPPLLASAVVGGARRWPDRQVRQAQGGERPRRQAGRRTSAGHRRV